MVGFFLPAHRRDDRGCGRQAAPQVTPAASMTEGPLIQVIRGFFCCRLLDWIWKAEFRVFAVRFLHCPCEPAGTETSGHRGHGPGQKETSRGLKSPTSTPQLAQFV